MSDQQFAKAQIHTVEKEMKNALAVECMFNPKEYSFSKKNSWSPNKNKGANVPEYEFAGGDPETLTLQLLFDTFESGKDVRKEYTEKVWQLMMVSPDLTDKQSGKGRPPRVRFHWGKAWSFIAVITSISQKFVLFKEDGTPVRAMLDVSFQQVADPGDYPLQNPSSGANSGGRQWTVKEGDTLASIAYAEYGDATRWRPIADVNRLVHVRRLRPGMTLEIPTLA